MKLLITGASGSLGRHVIDHLRRQNHQVSAMIHPADTAGLEWAAQNLFPVHIADVCDVSATRRAVAGNEAVIHLGGAAGVRLSDAARMMRTNVLGAQSVVKGCQAEESRLVHISSASAVGLSPSPEPIEEDFPFPSGKVTHAYPVSKQRGQQIVARAIRNGLDGVILNPGAVLAAGDPHANAWSALPRVLRAGLRWAPPGGFGFVGRVSLLEAIENALTAPASPESTLVIDQNASYLTVFNLVSRAVGGKPVCEIPTVAVTAALRIAGFARRAPLMRGRLQADSTLQPVLTWPNVYGGARSRSRLNLRQRLLEDAVVELSNPIPNGTES